MLALETVVKIRIDHLRNKVPIKAIARKRGVARNTVRKAVREGAEAFGSAGKRQPKPKLGPWIGELERMLAESAELPRRERPTLTRIHEDLAALGCRAGYDSVRRHAAAWSERQALEAPREAHVPLRFDPGEAFQFDWSTEEVTVGGASVTVKAAHFRLCHSWMAFVRLYRRESLEMLVDAHNRAFAFFGGSCRRGVYDNMKAAVRKIRRGREREADPDFADARRRHPGVESAINGLEHRGLDRVRLRGRDRFELAIGLSVIAANIHRIGRILRDRERALLLRERRNRAT